MSAARPITGTNLVGGTPYSANAWGDGSHDDTSVLQAALTACGLIHVPSGTYRITSTLTVPSASGGGISGDGVGFGLNGAAANAGTTFYADFTGTAITNSCANPLFENFEILRNGTPTSGTYGLDMGSANVNGIVRDVMSWGNYFGFFLRGSGTSTAEGLWAQSNLSAGFVLDGTWNMSQTLAQSNGGHGYLLQGSIDCGDLDGLSTFDNAGYGVYVSAMPNVRLTNSFLGGDGTGGTGYGVYLGNTNSVGKSNQLTHCYVEAEPNAAYYAGANTRENYFTNCVGSAAQQGLLNDSAAVTVQSGWYTGGASDFCTLMQDGACVIVGIFASLGLYGVGATINTDSLVIVGNYLSCATPKSLAIVATDVGNYS